MSLRERIAWYSLAHELEEPLSLRHVVAREARRRCGEAMQKWDDDPENEETRQAFLDAIQAVETSQRALRAYERRTWPRGGTHE